MEIAAFRGLLDALKQGVLGKDAPAGAHTVAYTDVIVVQVGLEPNTVWEFDNYTKKQTEAVDITKETVEDFPFEIRYNIDNVTNIENKTGRNALRGREMLFVSANELAAWKTYFLEDENLARAAVHKFRTREAAMVAHGIVLAIEHFDPHAFITFAPDRWDRYGILLDGDCIKMLRTYHETGHKNASTHNTDKLARALGLRPETQEDAQSDTAGSNPQGANSLTTAGKIEGASSEKTRGGLICANSLTTTR